MLLPAFMNILAASAVPHLCSHEPGPIRTQIAEHVWAHSTGGQSGEVTRKVAGAMQATAWLSRTRCWRALQLHGIVGPHI
jgi:hypothetical protein